MSPSSDASIASSPDSPSAFCAGADLWVVADPESSQWARQIDWYLNFQLLRSQTHQRAELSSEIRAVMEKWDVEEVSAREVTSAPLLIAASDRLPTHAVVMIPRLGVSPADWTLRVHQIWKGLDAPSLRVFLPAGLSSVRFEKDWPDSLDVLSGALIAEED